MTLPSKRVFPLVFLDTHNLAEVEKLCARVAVNHQGKLLAVGAPDELRGSLGGLQAEIVGDGFTGQMLAALREQPEVVHAELHNNHLTIKLRGDSRMRPPRRNQPHRSSLSR